MALAMTYLGARNETAKQMAEVLNFAGVSEDQLHSSFSELMQSLTTQENCTLDIANRLYPQKDYKILQEFIDATSKHYKTTVENVDFAGSVEEARKSINEWVESSTKQKIKDLLQPGTLDTLTRLVLVNAIYFKGDWNEKFEASKTNEADFRLADGSTVKVPMMNMQKKLQYGLSRELKDVKALRLPYAGGKLSFMVLLPEHPEGIDALENDITVDHVVNCDEKFMMQQKDVIVSLPKFKLEDSFDLGATLSKLGMKDLFSDAADLSGITGNKELSVSKVVHKSFIEVNEEGSEAAAATAAVMQVRSLPRTFNFIADHPFLFFIRDDESGSILFMGKYARPQ
jgi:serpin B